MKSLGIGLSTRWLRPRPDVFGYFSIRKFFFADSKVSTSTRIRIHMEFARRVHTHSDSLSIRQLIYKAISGSCENFITNILQ